MENKENTPGAGATPIDIPEDIDILYSNLVRISHSPSDLVMDFGHILPAQKAKIVARIVMSPVGTKLFAKALTENLARYEATFGEIRLPGDASLANDLFKQIKPPEPPKDKE
jgi:hypothetical protein